MRYSNCILHATKEVLEGNADQICIILTEYSSITWTGKWWWAPVRWFGRVLIFLSWGGLEVGSVAATGRWHHATFRVHVTGDGRKVGEYHEYVPIDVLKPGGKKVKHILPPPFFVGGTRRVEEHVPQPNDRRQGPGLRETDKIEVVKVMIP